MRLKLWVKQLIVVALGVLLPMEAALLYLLYNHEREVEDLFLHHGRIICGQIIATRSWLSEHGGVYVRKTPSVRPSPYFKNEETATITGIPLTMRSPETFTHELAELYSRSGEVSIRLVSLDPINPMHLPDPWEKAALESFSGGGNESYEMIKNGGEPMFRYMAALRTEPSCTGCHYEIKNKIGAVRGGLSLEIPAGAGLHQAEVERGELIAAITALALLGMTLMIVGTRQTLLKPIYRIHGVVSGMEKGDFGVELGPSGNDELGELAREVERMRTRVRDHGLELEAKVEERTRELTETKQRLQDERDRLITLFDRMADGVCVAGADRNIEYINPSLEQSFGESGGRSCHQIVFDSDEACPECPFAPDEKGGMRRREVKARHGNKIFEVLETELPGPGGAMGWLMVFRDITERKFLETELFEINRDLEAKVKEQTEALLEKERLASLGEISSGLAHEIRNPLSAILSGVTLLESKKRTEAEREHIVSLIKREAKRLNTSLTDFLLFARPQPPKKVRIDIGGLIREISRLIEDDESARGEAEISLEIDDLPPVWFDDDQARQMIWNVALNALQSMGGKGRLTLRTRRAGDLAVIEIEDTGPGITDEVAEKIFDPFFTTRKNSSGLGLSIVRRIVTAHQGTIWFENVEGGGIRFIISVPGGWEQEKT